jgi:release factor glutamine methyltransferase
MEITIQEIIGQLSQILQPSSETAALDAQVLAAHHLDKPRSWVLAHPEAVLSNLEHTQIMHSIQRLRQGEPLPYVIGHWEFFQLNFVVTPEVLIPRPETELLVETAILWLQMHARKRRVVDVGTGSGCIGITIAKHIPDVRLLMVDISSEALNIARLNAQKHALQNNMDFCQSDLLGHLPRTGQFDLICANLPYIPTTILEKLPVVKREPRLALDGGSNGRKVIERLLRQAREALTPGGLMLLEIDPAECKQVCRLGQQCFPSSRVQVLQDLSGKDRCVKIEQSSKIYHLCPREDWLNSQASGQYRAVSLALEGFIHCSLGDQIIAVANRYYRDAPDLIILTIDTDKLMAEIRLEKSGEAYYPHVYGPINLDAVELVTGIHADQDRVYRRFNSPLE